MSRTYEVVPVGTLHSSLRRKEEAPHQGRDAGTVAEVRLHPAYEPALEGLEGQERILLICWLHLANRETLRVHPRGDVSRPLAGVFATRAPARPNPIAVYVADLLDIRGSVLRVRGVDAIDGTPVLDIKPFIPRLDT